MRGWVGRNRGILAAALLALAVLVPFLNKPYHVDDPFFLWTAQHIRQNPLDFYGFTMNWYGHESRVCDDAKNPPLACYYIAAASLVVGWSEPAIHAAMLLPLLALVAATFLLAQRVGARPFIASAATLLTPVMLLSSTTVMCDVLMLCFYVWAIYLWIRGIDERRVALLLLAGVLVGASALTKYFGATAIPLMAAYAILRTRRPGWWIAALIVPLAMLAGYEWYTKVMYDRGMIVEAIRYATRWRWHKSAEIAAAASNAPKRAFLNMALTSLAFAGGCCATIALLVLLTSRWWVSAVGAVMAGAVAAILWLANPFEKLMGGPAVSLQPTLRAEVTIFVALAGVMLLGLTVWWWGHRDAQTTTLLLWMWGTFLFAGFVNWSVNGRVILPMAPAAAILAARAIDERRWASARFSAAGALLFGGALAIAVSFADMSLAKSSRDMAMKMKQHSEIYAGQMWFQGHWGFQWYMQQLGFKPLNSAGTQIRYADVIAWPMNNSNKIPIPPHALRLIQQSETPLMPLVSTMDATAGSGFYSDAWGPLPFAIGPVASEKYAEFQAMTGIKLQIPPPTQTARR